MTLFSDLGLAPALLQALETEGYATPTPIQAQAIPRVLEGRDLLGIAQTGTGKTAAFALPILHRLEANRRRPARRSCRALVLSPTRELATQIAEGFRSYGRNLGFGVATVFGGVGHAPQIRALSNGVDILVATPGRLLDHIASGNVILGSTEVLVLDEADQMLDLGFLVPIRRIVATLPAKRQNLFFSATMPKAIKALAGELLTDPAEVAVTPVASTAERVSQQVILVESAGKRAVLAELFADPALARTLVFTRTKHGADKVTRHLEAAGIAAAAIHGNKNQNQRERALAAFKEGRVRALVATDIAARGIDVDAVTHVVNYELPNVPESYVHRIGRTARAGAEGIAISLCDHEERAYLRDIERLIRQSIPVVDRRSAPAMAGPAQPPSRPERPHRPHGDRPHAERAAANGRRQGGRPQAQRQGQPPRQAAERAAPGHGGAGGEPRRRTDAPRPRAGAGDGRDMSGLSWMRPAEAGRGDAGHRDAGRRPSRGPAHR